MTLYIDADGCPVVDIAIRAARDWAVPVILMCDTAHHFQREGAETLTVSKGADSVDFALVNRVRPGDVVVTQDYGLAAMCLAKKATPVHQNGHIYTPENIDALLTQRHTARKARMAGQRTKGPKKRTPAQDKAFDHLIRQVLSQT